MKRILSLAICILMSVAVIAFAACTGVDIDYNISFSVDGEVVATVGTDGSNISMPKNPEKEGYVFDGWYWDDGVWNKPFTLNSLLDQPIQETNSYTVYAKWINTLVYTITFDANGGSGKMSDQTAAIDVDEMLKANLFVAPDGYVFDKWNTEADGSGDDYTDGSPVHNLCGVGETVILYAQWHRLEKNYYTVVFNANGGVGENYSQDMEVSGCYFLMWNTFSAPTDSVFVEWNTRPDGSGESYEDHSEVSDLCEAGETLTLYAQWRSRYYTVVYNSNGGIGGEVDERATVGYAYWLKNCTFTRRY